MDKKFEFKVNGKKTITVDKGFAVGLNKKDKIKFNLVGEMNIEEFLDMVNTMTYEMLNMVLESLGSSDDVQKQIYQRAVLGFSLMIDKFYPEGVKTKFNGLTEEAILKAQNEILRNKSKKA
jgi:hypothetical protein